jgi:diguanylate cyclase (GGDEF)-like protein
MLPLPDSPVTRYKCSVLIVDDEPAVLTVLGQQLGREFEVTAADTVEQAKQAIELHPPDIVLSDLHLRGGTGLQLLEWVQRTAPKVARVLLTGTGRIEDAADAINCCGVHRILLKPLRGEDLLAAMRSVARGLLLERSHEQLLDEYRHLNQELEKRVQERTQELEQALHQVRVKNQILEKMALTDVLTGLPNRRAIELIGRKEVLRRTRDPAPIAFGLLDADHFKLINSHHLLSGGDHVLAWLAQVLQASIRATDALGRVGGEEFMVVAPLTDLAGAEVLAERLRATVEGSVTEFHGTPIPVTVSGGFAVAAEGVAVVYEQLREAAAEALAEAKATGRNRCVVRSLK